MKWLLHLIGIFLVAAGSAYILYTQNLRSALFRIMHTANPKLLSIAPLAIGVLLILSAFHSFNSWFIIVLGLLAVIKGLLLIIAPRTVYERMLRWYFEKASDRTIRFFGIVALVIGTAVMCWVK
jgi:uncharacterized protein YjeT (DUF2065 family)